MARVVNGVSVALVTGSASGIGLATMRRAAELEYLRGIRHRDDVPTKEAASSAGGRVVHVDVRDPLAVKTAVGEVEREVGPVALAIGAAGMLIERPFASIDEELWNDTLEAHLGGIYNLTVAVVPAMAERGDGSIVALSSELAFLVPRGTSTMWRRRRPSSVFTRAAARGTRSPWDSRQLRRARANGHPAPRTQRARPQLRGELIALRRLGRPEEVALAILDVARWPWTTGQLYGVNGGAVIR